MKVSRRAFLIAGGAVGGGLAVGLATGVGALGLHDRRATQQAGLEAADELVALWVQIRPDNSIVVLSPHTEMGQGAQTGLAQIVAEELDVAWNQVEVRQAPVDPAFSNGTIIQGFILGDGKLTGFFQRVVENAFFLGGDLMNLQMTGGSASVRFTGWRSMRIAAAAARQMLITAAATRMEVPIEQLTTRDAIVHHAASSRSMTFGELAPLAAVLSVPQEPPTKDPSTYRHVGVSRPRADIPDKVFGTAVYGIDKEVPGMLYAAVTGAKQIFGEVVSIDNKDEILARRGVRSVVIVQEGVAVVADNPWRAEQAALAVRFTEAPGPHASASTATLLEEQKRELADTSNLSSLLSRGDVTTPQGTVVQAEYFVPFLAHAPMEPMNVTLWREGDVTHVAMGTQNPLLAKATVADMLGVADHKLVFHPHTMGGGFGRRAVAGDDMMNFVNQAIVAFRSVDAPVKLTWSREMETRQDRYRKQAIATYRGVVNGGAAVAWQADSCGEVNIVDDAVTAYNIPNLLARTVQRETFVPYAYWRSVEASVHCFFNESFVDELAHAAKADPLQFRIDHLPSSHRLRAVLQAAREMSGWTAGVAPDGTAMGVAAYDLFGSFCCQVAKVSLVNGRPRVHDVWCALDCGVVVNPDGVEAQMQGGMIYGLTAALYGRIDIEDGGVKQSNFHDYRMVRLADAPRLHVRLLASTEAPGGVGEVAVPHLSAAVANAMAVLGDRPRSLPLIS